MALTRIQKETMVAEVSETLKTTTTLVLVENKGLTVAEVSELRNKMREAGGQYRVVKNRLAKLALKDTDFEHTSEMFTGPTAMATSQDAVAAAKVVADFAKKNEKLIILGGAYGKQALDEKGVKNLASMPSLDELRAKIISMLQTPATRIAGVTQAPGGQLARVIAAYSKKEG